MAERKSRIWAIVRVASGNFLEMYDFMVFGYYAAAIGKAFFPDGRTYASLMLALMTFGAGFLMRPVGAIVLGTYADRHGRRAGLILTLALMSVGTLSVACVPGYAKIGILAPILVLAGRLLQGFSAGMELGGVSVYLSEIATPGKKGFYVSWQSASQQIAVMFAALLGYALSVKLSPATMSAWGWRIPLLVGCLIVPFLFWLRSSLEESEEFLNRKTAPGLSEIMRSLRQHAGLVLLGMMLFTMTTVSFYMITAYTPTFGSQVLHFTTKQAFIVTFFVGASNLFWLPVMGALSDRVGRTPILIVCTSLMLLTSYPAMLWLVGSPSMIRLLMVELWFSFVYASFNGALIAYVTELIPIGIRTLGFSLAYSLATAVFGGFTPAISTYLIHASKNRAAPGLWLAFAAMCGLIAALITRNHPVAFEAPVTDSPSAA